MFEVQLFIEDGGNSDTTTILTDRIPNPGDIIRYGTDDKAATVQCNVYKLSNNTLLPFIIVAWTI